MPRCHRAFALAIILAWKVLPLDALLAHLLASLMSLLECRLFKEASPDPSP